MPRARRRERIVWCDCLDCLDAGDESQLVQDALEASARQLPPPKSLVFVVTGAFPESIQCRPATTEAGRSCLPHLDRVAFEGCCGLLVVEGGTEILKAGARRRHTRSHDAPTLQHGDTGVQGGTCQGGASFMQFPRGRSCTATLQGSSAAESQLHANILKLAAAIQVPGQQQLVQAQAALPRAASSSISTGAALDPSSLRMPGASWARACFSQLLGSCPAAEDGTGAPTLPSEAASLASRFQGLQAAVSSTDAGVRSLASRVGCRTFNGQLLPVDSASSASNSCSASDFAHRILNVLEPPAARTAAVGAEVADDVADDSTALELDMLLVHLDALDAPMLRSEDFPIDTPSESASTDDQEELLQWLDAVVKHLSSAPGFKESVLLSIVIGECTMPSTLLDPGGRVITPGVPCATGCPGGTGSDHDGTTWSSPVQRPRQSFQVRGTDVVDAKRWFSLLVVHRLLGVTRRDNVRALNVGEVAAEGGGGAILIERMIHEIAYKIARAPKYGA